MGKSLIVGFGSWQGADAVGWQVTDALQQTLPEQEYECVNLLTTTELLTNTALNQYDSIHILDALQIDWVRAKVVELNKNNIKDKTLTSSHGVNLKTVIELLNSQQVFTPTLYIWGISTGPELDTAFTLAEIKSISQDISKRILATPSQYDLEIN
jgi:hydrogenase maturation protease